MGQGKKDAHDLGDIVREADDYDTDNLKFLDDDGPSKAEISVLADGWGPYMNKSLREIFLGTKLNMLLPCIPLAMISNAMGKNGWGDGWTFTFALLGIAPLAERLNPKP